MVIYINLSIFKINDWYPQEKPSFIGCILIDMPRYYGEEFDFEKYVISIRQLDKLEKKDNNFRQPLAIEGSLTDKVLFCILLNR